MHTMEVGPAAPALPSAGPPHGSTLSAFQPVLPSRPAVHTPPEADAAHPDSSPAPSSTASERASPAGLASLTDEAEDPPRAEEARFALPAHGQNAFAWPLHLGDDERRQLLGTEEESSERPSSDDEDDKDTWGMTREQLNYYTTQFFSMQSNPRGVIPGSQAKEFFEKSHLPITELRQIWQLSDVTKDGCLSLEEFLTAMHLVVLRRNAIELPSELPRGLQPLALKARVVDRHNKDLYHQDDDDGLDGGADSLLPEDHPDPLSQHDDRQPPTPPSTSSRSRLHDESGGLTSPGSVSSPGPKPVNFDFHRPDARRNPHLVQPVAMRLSPESPVIPTSDDDDPEKGVLKVKQGRREVVYEQLWNQEDAASATEESLSSLTLKASVTSGPGRTASSDKSDMTDEEEVENSTEIDESDGILSPSPSGGGGAAGFPVRAASHGVVSLPYFSDALQRMKKTTFPPAPPPRVTANPKTHTRSSSLDLNRYQRGYSTMGPQIPPAVPPRPELGPGGRSGKELQFSIHQLKDKNSVVARTINELHQEISDTLEERIGLEYQLEQLKSFGD